MSRRAGESRQRMVVKPSIVRAMALLLLLDGGLRAARADTNGAPASVAAGDEAAEAEAATVAADADDPPEASALAFGAAVVPGVLLRGSGLYVAGDRAGAVDLLALGGAGLGLAAASGMVLGFTGASAKVAWPAIPLGVSGLGLFATTWLSELFATAGLGSLGAAAPPPVPIEVSLGYAFVRDPQFDFSHFTVAEARFFHDGFIVEPSAWIAMSADNQRWRLASSYRLFGARPGRVTSHNHWLDIGGAFVFHDFGDDGFHTVLGEISLLGRLDLSGLSPLLAGQFIELGTGVGLEWLHYDLGELGDADDAAALLLSTVALGFRFGDPGRAWGQARLGYDHRRDDFAAGLSPPARGSGFAGHLGGDVVVFVDDWGVRSYAWLGAAHVYGVSLAHRFGGIR